MKILVNLSALSGKPHKLIFYRTEIQIICCTFRSMAKKKVKAKTVTHKQVVDAYVSYIVDQDEQHQSEEDFISTLGIEDSTFYNNYRSFSDLDQYVWQSFIEETLSILQADVTYQQYGASERLLAFYYTHFEVLHQYRDYIKSVNISLIQFGTESHPLHLYKKDFFAYIQLIIEFGIQNDEIGLIKFLTDKYHQGFWVQHLFLLDFWKKDKSEANEATDAAIEKSVHLIFQIIGKGTLEAIVDFGKFMFQHRSKE